MSMGKYHPHGDTAIYDALVRMAQAFSMRLPLIDGQGNFGSVDGDPPAADALYGIAARPSGHWRCSKTSIPTLSIFSRITMKRNMSRWCCRRDFPIFSSMARAASRSAWRPTFPPHNLGEVIDAAIALIDRPEMTIEDLMAIIPGPDFPTGGYILGRAGIRAAYMSGRGSVLTRAKVEVEEIRKEREALIVTEIPYQINKATLIEKIAELVREKRVEGISDLRDESDRDGMRIVIEIKRDASPMLS